MMSTYKVELLELPWGYEATVVDEDGNRAAVKATRKTKAGILSQAGKLIRDLEAASYYGKHRGAMAIKP